MSVCVCVYVYVQDEAGGLKRAHRIADFIFDDPVMYLECPADQTIIWVVDGHHRLIACLIVVALAGKHASVNPNFWNTNTMVFIFCPVVENIFSYPVPHVEYLNHQALRGAHNARNAHLLRSKAKLLKRALPWMN